MKFGAAMATLALIALLPSVPAAAAKDERLPRCDGRQKRPANLYGTVLPTVPPRNMTSAAAPASAPGVPRGTPSPSSAPAQPMNLFPPERAAPSSQGPNTSHADKVPAIGAIEPGPGPTAALTTTFASC